MEKWYSTKRVAVMLDITERRVRALCQSGRLNAVRPGRDWLIPQSALDAYEPQGAGRPSMEACARERVRSTPALDAHADTILYDWPEGDEHWQWVFTADVDEIVDWAETVERS
jgi:excisionase family DNA binding protein